jgi:hypothetical protein
LSQAKSKGCCCPGPVRLRPAEPRRGVAAAAASGQNCSEASRPAASANADFNIARRAIIRWAIL